MNQNLRATAYHEAGHAIAADELGQQIGCPSVIQNGETRGRVPIEGTDGFYGDPSHPDYESDLKTWAFEQAVSDYAGHAALVALLGIGDMGDESAQAEGAGPDFDNARARLGGDPGRIAQAQARALEIVKARGKDVCNVAAALLERKRLSPDEVDWLIINGPPIPDWFPGPGPGEG